MTKEHYVREALVVGFDLDMTLVDSAQGISEALVAVCKLHGVEIRLEDALATIGLPLDQVFPMWLPSSFSMNTAITMASTASRSQSHCQARQTRLRQSKRCTVERLS